MSLKDITNIFKDPSKKLYLYTFILIVIFVFVLLIVLLANIFGNKNVSYEQMERQLVSSAKDYATSKKMLMKKDLFKKTIKINTLIENKYMKELKKYNKNYETCEGNVTITYNGKKFLYTPFFDCGKAYKTKYLKDEIKNSKLNDNKDGIYSVDDYYIYRGENPNNYIKFANQLWRIVKIESDETIKIVQVDSDFDSVVFDDRYNSSCPKDEYNCAGFSNFETSRLKDKMLEIFNEGIDIRNEKFSFSKFEKTIVNYQQLCVGPVSENLRIEEGYPECQIKTEGKYPFDFIKLNEYIMASLDSDCQSIKDKQCTNYNYMIKNVYGWTITTTAENNYEVYYLAKLPILWDVSTNDDFIFTVNLSSNTLYKSGTGTEEDPYIIKNVIE